MSPVYRVVTAESVGVTSWWVQDEPYVVVGPDGQYRSTQSFETAQQAQERADELTWEEAQPIGVRGSGALTEARTVLSRAATAAHQLSQWLDYNNRPDENRQIHADLVRVVEILEKYERTGRMPKYPGKKP